MEPPTRLMEAMTAKGLKLSEFHVLKVGESVTA